jgi:hypothetical protein
MEDWAKYCGRSAAPRSSGEVVARFGAWCDDELRVEMDIYSPQGQTA